MKQVTKSISVESLESAPWNPRKGYNQKLVDEIAEQLREGKPLLQKPGAWEYDDGKYYIVYGNTRMAAVRQAGIEELEVTVYECSREEAMAMTFQENEMRDDVYPIAQAVLVGKIFDSGKSVEEIVGETGLKKSSVYDYLNIARRVHPDLIKFAQAHPKNVTKDALLELTKYTQDTQASVVDSWSASVDEDDEWRPSLWPLRNKVKNLSGCKWAGKGSPCETCPRNTANIGQLPGFEEAKAEGQCEDSKCYEETRDRWLKAQVEKKTAKAKEVYYVDYEYEIKEAGATASRPSADNPCAYVYVDKYNGTFIVKYGPSAAAKVAAEKAEKERQKAEKEAAADERNMVQSLRDAVVDMIGKEDYDERCGAFARVLLKVLAEMSSRDDFEQDSLVRRIGCEFNSCVDYYFTPYELCRLVNMLKLDLALTGEQVTFVNAKLANGKGDAE